MTEDMPPAEFRRYGHEVVDWIADYIEHIRDYPVLARVKPGELKGQLPSAAPEQGESMDALLADFRELILPAVTHWNHPRCHGYFPASASGPGILAECLAASLNMNGMLWRSAPAATELEQVTVGWLRDWLGLPEEFFGVIHDTASSNTMYAMAAARQKKVPGLREAGSNRTFTMYTSEHAHSSVEKAAMTLGVGLDNVRKIGVDTEFRMRPDLVREAIEADLAAGRTPFLISATVATTSVTSIDPVPALADIAAEYRLWLHVDAAYGGAAAVVPEFRHVLDGADRADSLVINPHKWLFAPVDLSVLYTRHPNALRQTFSLVPEYLRTAEDDRVVNFMDYGVPLGRRFRSLKLWFVMRYFGREGVAGMIRNHIQWARQFADWVRADNRFEVVAPVTLSLICFRYRGSNEENERLMEAVNRSGVALLSHNVMDGKFVLRCAVGNVHVTEDDVRLVWQRVRDATATLAR